VNADLQKRLSELTLEQKVRLLTGADAWGLHDEPAIGLRRMVTSDGPAGVRGELWEERDPSANVPSPTALSATWDVDRVHRIGQLLAAEARRKGVDVLLAPTVNLQRTPYGGRHFECFSEDPLLTGVIGGAYVRGVQSGGVAATVKHFVANDSETQRFTLDAIVDERVLRELYLEPFDQIVREAGAWAVMAAYNAVNGVTMTEHPMLRDVLKDEWGFDGVVMSDWYATRSTEPAGNAALDLAMPGPTGPWGAALVQAVRDGRVSEDAVDDKVLRLLRLAARVGALNGFEAARAPVRTDADTAEELRSAAAAGFVLLRNDDDTLPLDPSTLHRVAVIGPNAVQPRTLGGGSATVFPPYTVSPVDGLRAALGPRTLVRHANGVRISDRLPTAPIELLRLPGGDGNGVEVRFLAADGTVLSTEQRQAAGFTWIDRYASDLPMSAVAGVEVHGRLRADTAGTYRIGGSGVGPLALRLGNREVFRETLALAEGSDVVEAMMRPPQRAEEVTLAEGEEAPFVLRYDPQPAGGFGDVEVSTVHFQLVADRPHGNEESEIDRAVSLASGADVAVVVVGTTEEVESEGFDRESLALPGRQDDLVRRVRAVNPRTIVVVNSGAPVLLPWADDVPAILATWFPGQEFGNALADVLFGVTEPGGRLPVTWPADPERLPSTQPEDGVLPYTEGLFVGYRGYDRDGRTPLFAFGHGLGYTSWVHLGAAAGAPGADGAVTVEVRVRNAGRRRGREIVQVYASRDSSGPTSSGPTSSGLPRAERWLAGFAAVDADPGEEVTATITVPARAFRHWDVDRHEWAVEPGEFRLEIGSSSQHRPLTATVQPVSVRPA
jgi:beta-glucosidase